MFLVLSESRDYFEKNFSDQTARTQVIIAQNKEILRKLEEDNE